MIDIHIGNFISYVQMNHFRSLLVSMEMDHFQWSIVVEAGC